MTPHDTAPAGQAVTVLTLAAVLGAGAVAGVFFAFSTFVMSGLGRLSPERGTAAMQSINITAVRPAFMILLFGTALVSLPLVVHGVRHRHERPAVLLLVGGLLYLVGAIGVTVVRNVPMNDALAPLHPSATATADVWAHYLSTWTAWNHVRTLASFGATAAFALALLA